MIGRSCKRREAFRRAVLIGRALPLRMFGREGAPPREWRVADVSRCAALRALACPEMTAECPSLVSDHGRGGTPGPIPNPEVKPPSADGTAERVRGRAGRR